MAAPRILSSGSQSLTPGHAQKYLNVNNHAYDFRAANRSAGGQAEGEMGDVPGAASKSEAFRLSIGFVPQRRLSYQLHLPYCEQIEAEALVQLAEIRSHLPRAVALEDIHNGASYWVAKLDRYIRLYGEFFSKDDHVLFTRLLYSLATWKHLEPRLVEKFSTVFKTLTKKRKLLSKKDLTLDWKPLYETIKFFIYSREKAHGLLQVSSSFDSTLLNDLAAHSRSFFPASAVQEIWEEFRFRLCPVSEKFADALFFLNYLMPVSFNSRELPATLRVWLDEFMELWLRYRQHESLEQEMMHIVARVAQRARGYVDWEPYMGHLFTSLLRRLDLPVGQGCACSSSYSKFDINMACCLLIYAIHDQSSVIARLGQFFNAVDTFFHPSNAGEWTTDLCTVLCGLANYLHIRVYCERVLKPCEDDAEIPESYRIKDAHIDELVHMILPRAMTAVFNKTSNLEMGRILTSLRSLAFLRPNVVVPKILDTVFPSLKTLLEPHRLHDSLSCLAVTLLPLVQRTSQYAGGQRHVVPLLQALLPAIDYNDSRKSNSALSIIAYLCSMISVADHSQMLATYRDLDDEEKEVLTQTALLEDFAVDLMDRMFSVIQAMYAQSQDHLHPSGQDSDKEEESWTDSMQNALENLIRNSSVAVQDRMLERMYEFVANNTMDWKTSGEVVSSLVYCFCRIVPERTCRLFLPHFMRILRQRLREGDELFTDEFLDSTFLWHLQVITSVLNGGVGLLEHAADIEEILQTLVRVKCKHALKIGRQLLDNVLTSLTATLMNCRPFSESPLSVADAGTPPTRLWGRVVRLQQYKVAREDFNLPTEASVAFAQRLVDTVAGSVADKLAAMCDGQLELSQDQRSAYIGLLKSTVQGVEHLAPMWQAPLVPLSRIAEISAPTEVTRFAYRVDSFEILWRGANLRDQLRQLARRLFRHLTAACEDDTQSLEELILLYNSLLFPFSDYVGIKKVLMKWINNVVIFCRNSLLGKEYHLPVYHFLKLCVCHCTRLLSNSRRLDEKTLEMGNDLYHVAVHSRYEKTRAICRGYLIEYFYRYRQTPQIFLPKACEELTSSQLSRHEFEGALELLREFYADFANTVYSVVPQVAQALVAAKLSPYLLEGNVDKKVDDLELSVMEALTTLNVAKPEMPSALRQLAEAHAPAIGDEERRLAKEVVAADFALRLELFRSSTDWMLGAAGANESSWQIVRLIMDLLPGQYDVEISEETFRFILHHLRSSVPAVRSNACHLLDAVLYSKRFVQRSVQLPQPCEPAASRRPGPRPDNQFLLYSRDRDLFKDQATWNSFYRVDKEVLGFAYWPPVIRLKDPADCLDADRPMDSRVRMVRDFFELDDTWEFLLAGMTSLYEKDRQNDSDSQEEVDDLEKFPTENLVCLLARTYGPRVFRRLFGLVRELLAASSGQDKEDVIHKSAAGIVGGLLRGSKAWSFADYKAMWQAVVPLIDLAISTVSESSLNYWVEVLAYLWNDCTLSPYRLTPLLTYFREQLDNGNGSVFKESVRLKLLCICLLSLHWRGIELQHEVLPYVLANLNRQDSRIRATASSVLSAFLSDLDYESQGFDTSRLPFTTAGIVRQHLLPALVRAKDALMALCADSAALTPVKSTHDMPAAAADPEDAEMSASSELSASWEAGEPEALKTDSVFTIRSICTAVSQAGFSATTLPSRSLWDLLPPMLELLQISSFDPMLEKDLTGALDTFMIVSIPEAFAREFVQLADSLAAGLVSWKSREYLLRVLQACVFFNLFALADQADGVLQLVLRLLQDDNLDVRKAACGTLSGLLRCGYLRLTPALMQQLTERCRTRLRKRQPGSSGPELCQVNARHSGVLGLCSIVEAAPYDVPEHLPPVLMALCRHANDPEPIRASARAALANFKRTHQETWHADKEKFTEEELLVLTDLLVSPNYYA